MLNDKELYRELGSLTKRKEDWRASIAYVGALLDVGANNDSPSPKITAKALWLLGEMGLLYPEETAPYVEKIASFLDSQEDLLREFLNTFFHEKSYFSKNIVSLPQQIINKYYYEYRARH